MIRPASGDWIGRGSGASSLIPGVSGFEAEALPVPGNDCRGLDDEDAGPPVVPDTA